MNNYWQGFKHFFTTKEPLRLGIGGAAFISALLGLAKYLDGLETKIAQLSAQSQVNNHHLIAMESRIEAIQQSNEQTLSRQVWESSVSSQQTFNVQVEHSLGELNGHLESLESIVYELNTKGLDTPKESR